MKFAKELEQDLVPEWRIKYLNYKAGKKLVKAVTRVIHRANGTPSFRRSGDLLPPRNTPSFLSSKSPFTPGRRKDTASPGRREEESPLRASPAPIGRAGASTAAASPMARPARRERQGLAESSTTDVQYGSIAPAPRSQSPLTAASRSNAFELPAPAIRIPSNTSEPMPKLPPMPEPPLSRMALQRSATMAPSIPVERHSATLPSRSSQPTGLRTRRATLRRIFTFSHMSPPVNQKLPRAEYDMRSLGEVRERECDFFRFMDGELEKIETFYKQKEDQAGQRLVLLRDQLHEMRNRRTEEVRESRRRRNRSKGHVSQPGEDGGSDDKALPANWTDPLTTRLFKPGPNSKALSKMPMTPHMRAEASASAQNGQRDYVRRRGDHEVPYRTAKRKLKLALQEFYRGLDLLKSYALLNRKAFRKLNKKYDKAVNARPPYRYLNEKVNKAWFVNSDVLDGHLQAAEDLYARYFEGGNHKIAAGKLRNLTKPLGDESASAFSNGLLIGIGSVFAIQGLVEGAKRLFDDDPILRQQTSFLLQVYGGYFLMLYLMFMFCLVCRIWTRNKINYPFIFELDPRSNLDWRQLSQFPSFFLLVFGLCIWLNFSGYGSSEMYLYYPVLLICVTTAVLFLPAPVIWHRSRRWFLYSHWRLLLAGIYPVEFRDFFLGDIYCSLTYATANIEIFFCLYTHNWNDPKQCNSSHSRLLGFFITLPPIWRALQCIRRYYDTRNVFPHLVNCGKYTMTILSAVCLSVYRMGDSRVNLSAFIAVSVINAIYCTFWDLFMDFSLLQSHSRHFLLRDILALKNRWPYYAIMAADPVLRFGWVFYAIFTHDTQHSSIVSFLVSLAEVTRRGAWTLFRVENEHCANVAQYKAHRDVPLPYRLDDDDEDDDDDNTPQQRPSIDFPGLLEPASTPVLAARATGVSAGGGASQGTAEEGGLDGGTVRRRRPSSSAGKRSISVIMAEAHKQDFEKKRRPEDADAARPIEEEEEDAIQASDDDNFTETEERMEAREDGGFVEGLGGAQERAGE